MRAPEFWKADGALARLLDPVGRVYGFAGAFRRSRVIPKQAGVPVICVGNVTVGGAGKTPTAIAIAKRLLALNANPHFLTRGYGGRERGPLRVNCQTHTAADVGDEPLLLSKVASTWVSANRILGAERAANAGASHIIMDDGLQNPYLAMDLSFLVVDGATGFGNRRLLPAGPLREPIEHACSRVDAVIVIGQDRTDVEASLPAGLVCLSAGLCPDGATGHLAGRRVLAFAGIGRPQKFYDTLERIGADIVQIRSFPDHHRYRPTEIEALIAKARQFDAVCITTEKDHVRLPSNLRNAVEKLAIRVQFKDPDSLDRLLRNVSVAHAAGAK